jgi:hypothetical protein
MYMYICICIYVYMYVCMYVYMYVCIYVHMYAHTPSPDLLFRLSRVRLLSCMLFWALCSRHLVHMLVDRLFAVGPGQPAVDTS